MKEDFTIEEEAFVRDFWDNRCAICGKSQAEETSTMPIDHWYPLSKGHALTMKNAVLLCRKHNSRKWKKPPEEVYDTTTIKQIETKIQEQVKAWESERKKIA